MSDVYTSTKGGRKAMECSQCGGSFAGTDANVFASDDHKILVLCDPCIRSSSGHA